MRLENTVRIQPNVDRRCSLRFRLARPSLLITKSISNNLRASSDLYVFRDSQNLGIHKYSVPRSLMHPILALEHSLDKEDEAKMIRLVTRGGTGMKKR